LPNIPKYKTIFKLSLLPKSVVACVGGSAFSPSFFGLTSAPFKSEAIFKLFTMSDSNKTQFDFSKFITIESEENLILLKTNQMITLTYTDEKGAFNSIMISPRNLCNKLYDSVKGDFSATSNFAKHSEKD
jgi:hypothetical protein